MGFDGAGGYNQLPGDLLVGSAEGDEMENFPLAPAQRLNQVADRGGFLCRNRMQFRIKWGELADGIIPQRTSAGMCQPLSQQHLHGLAFVQEDPHVSFWISKIEAAIQ